MNARATKTVFKTLTRRQKMTYGAHLFKALFKQHHKALLQLLRPYISKQDIIFDVGGHAGQMTKIFAKLAPEGRVYTFEPGSYALSILKKVVSFNRLKNVEICPFALSSETKESTLSIPLKKSGSVGFGISHIPTTKKETPSQHLEEKIKILPLDLFMEQNKIPTLSFLKIDVEGHEMQVLKGAKKTLKVHKPCVMLELNTDHLHRSNSSPTEVMDFMKDLGYTPYQISQGEDSLTDKFTYKDCDYLFSCKSLIYPTG